MDRNDFTDDFRRSCAGIDSGFDGADVTTDHDRDQTGPDFFITNEGYICCFDHGIGGFDGTDEASGFYHS